MKMVLLSLDVTLLIVFIWNFVFMLVEAFSRSDEEKQIAEDEREKLRRMTMLIF